MAQGSPKQELLMNRLSKVHAAVYMGLGGSFDVYTNTVHRAPGCLGKWTGVVLSCFDTTAKNYQVLGVVAVFVNLIRGKY